MWLRHSTFEALIDREPSLAHPSIAARSLVRRARGWRGQADRAGNADAALERVSNDAERRQQTDAPSARKPNRSGGKAFCLYIVACDAGPRRWDRSGARVRVVRAPRAPYYRVEFSRGGNGFRVLPVASTVDLPSRWHYRGKIFRFVSGQYRWEVWPGFGERRLHRSRKADRAKHRRLAAVALPAIGATAGDRYVHWRAESRPAAARARAAGDGNRVK